MVAFSLNKCISINIVSLDIILLFWFIHHKIKMLTVVVTKDEVINLMTSSEEISVISYRKKKSKWRLQRLKKLSKTTTASLKNQYWILQSVLGLNKKLITESKHYYLYVVLKGWGERRQNKMFPLKTVPLVTIFSWCFLAFLFVFLWFIS